MIDKNCKHEDKREIGINRGFEFALITVCNYCGLVLDEKVIEDIQ